MAYSEEDLLGTWKMVAACRQDVNTGEVSEAFGGPHPVGVISYGKDHRMMTVAAYDNRINPDHVDHATSEQRDQLFRTMFAYAGTYTVSGNSVQHHIEVSWNETWTGTTVTRDIRFQDGKLVLTTRSPLSLDAKTVMLTVIWEKVNQA